MRNNIFILKCHSVFLLCPTLQYIRFLQLKVMLKYSTNMFSIRFFSTRLCWKCKLVLESAKRVIKPNSRASENRKQFHPPKKNMKARKLFISNSDMFKNTFCHISRGSERFPYFSSRVYTFNNEKKKKAGRKTWRKTFHSRRIVKTFTWRLFFGLGGEKVKMEEKRGSEYFTDNIVENVSA